MQGGLELSHDIAVAAKPTDPRAGSGLTNGNGTARAGLTNGSRGRTNGGGLTNGTGRTNGSGHTNGTGGRTNGTGLRSLPAVRRQGTRRKAGALAAGAIFVTLAAIGALAANSVADTGVRVDGRFDEWGGHTADVQASNPAGVRQVGVLGTHSTVQGYLAFDSPPFATRADVWVFIDEDQNAATGYYNGVLGADSAVRILGDGGRPLGGTQYRFAGPDRFDLNGLTSVGAASVGASGPRVEFILPSVPRALSVAVATPLGATSTGAFLPTGEPISLDIQGLPTSTAIRNGILIDGDFSDWSGVVFAEDPYDAALPARLDLLKEAAIGDDGSAQFYVEARGGVLTGTLPLLATPLGPNPSAVASTNSPPPRRTAGTDLLEIYLDTDLSATTGSPIGGLGADLVLHVEGFNGKVVLAQVFAYDGAGWKPSSARLDAAAAGHAVELCAVTPGLVGARAVFVLSGFEGARDVSDAPVAVGRQAGGMTETAAPPLPNTRSDGQVNPIPEFSEVAGVVS